MKLQVIMFSQATEVDLSCLSGPGELCSLYNEKILLIQCCREFAFSLS